MAKFDNLDLVFNELDETKAVDIAGGWMKPGSHAWNVWVSTINRAATGLEAFSPAKGWSDLARR